MPYVRVSLAGPPLAADLVAELQQQVTALMADILGKRRDLTVVAVEQAAADAWSAGGLALNADMRCAQVEAFITAGSNGEDEKRNFLQAAYAVLLAILGHSDAPLYIIVREVPAADWGYDGLSQAARRPAAAAA